MSTSSCTPPCASSATRHPAPDGALPPVLHPGIPFAVHTAEGEALSVRAHGETREGAALRLADPDLAGLVVLDFDAFDAFDAFVAFHDELVDVELDGGQRDRPSGVVADALREEFGLAA